MAIYPRTGVVGRRGDIEQRNDRSGYFRISRGFSLVELLVVIGIIAVLISILLPTLSRAREAANTARCAANMRSAVQAMQIYATENRGWLAGPHTSGDIWNGSPASPVPGRNVDGNSYGLDHIGPSERHSDETPLQNMDWMSPTLGRTMTLPENDIERLKRFYDVELRCPSNDILFSEDASMNSESVNLDSAQIRSQSYGATILFHAFPRRDSASGSGFDSGKGDRVGISTPYDGNSSYKGLTAPRAYAPQFSRVGNPSEKVYLVEGSRYTLVGSGNTFVGISFNFARYQRAGGNFMVVPPYLKDNPRLPFALHPDTLQLTPVARALAWRHRGKMNLAFFDGHVETRAPRESVAVSLYAPPGTEITDANRTYDPNDINGMIVK